MLKISTLIAVLVLASTVTSNAEAHSMGSFYASPFFRNQGRQPAQPCQKDKRRDLEEAFARAREKRLAELRAERAQAAALAAKRARLAAIAQKKTAAARQAEKIAAAQPAPTAQQTPATDKTNVAKKSDLLPVATASNASTTTTQTAAAAPQTCRRYSAATDTVVEIPCP